MKKTFLVLAMTGITTAAFAQAHIGFQNDATRLIDWTANTSLLFPPEQAFAGQPIDQSSGHISVLIAGLYGGSSSGSLSLLTTGQFGTVAGSPGLISPPVHLVSPLPAGVLAYFEVKVWDSAYPSYEVALAATGGNDYFGSSVEFTYTPQSSLAYPGINTGDSTWPAVPIYVGLVPEPTSAALLGLAGVFILGRCARRRGPK